MIREAYQVVISYTEIIHLNMEDTKFEKLVASYVLVMSINFIVSVQL